ncbi:hypothetical protein [Microvirga massiliensis]|uniref:hypothetical protein n=1 Tax=Microvirga massiliensis TaxID=1033741 RepID=UPI00062BED23|nr:hypothetical protein [Microvirga massiliensis]
MSRDSDPERKLADLRAQGVAVDVDREARTLRVSFPRWMEADLLADLLRREHADDPVEAARNIWHFVAPVLRDCRWSDERIIREYAIPDEVLSGEADRRANVRAAVQRAGWVLEAPDCLFRGERPLIEAFRSGALSEEDFGRAHDAFLREVFRRERLIPESLPALSSDVLRVRITGGPDPDDSVVVTVDHLPTWRRAPVRACLRRLAAHYVQLARDELARDLFLLARGEEPLGEDLFTPEDER